MKPTDTLDEIGRLHEEGKGCLNLLRVFEDDRIHWNRCHEILRELRDLAETHWKKNQDLLRKPKQEYDGYQE